MKDAFIRALRTFFQTAIGVYLAGLVAGPALGDLANVDLLSSAGAAGFVAVLSFVQNLLENSAGVTYNKG
jgi:hypothetical protein